MRLGLRQKLVVLVLVILVPLLALLAFNLYRHFDNLESDQIDAQAASARIIATAVDRYNAELADVGEAAGTALVEGRGGEDPSVYLDAVRMTVGANDVALAGLDGRIVASALPSQVGSNLAGEPGFVSVRAGAPLAVSDLQRIPGGSLGFMVFSPVETSGTLLGVSAVSVPSAALGSLVAVSASREVVLITDGRGGLLYADRPELAPLTEQQRRGWSSPGVRQALAGRDFTSRSASIPRLQGSWLGAQVPARVSGWSVGVFEPAGQAFAAIAAELYINLGVIVLVLGLSLFAARQYGISLTRPLERLTDVTAQIERGRFDAQVPVTTRDEIGELAANFRRMQESLKHTLGDVGLLAESARWISSTLDLDSIARAAADYLERILGSRAVVLTLFAEPGTAEEERVVAPHLDPAAAEALATAAAAATRGVDLAEQAYALRAVPHDLAVPGAGDARYLVVLPLVVSHRVIGRIDALAAPDVPPLEFEQSDVALAASLAQQVAVAAENARLFEQQREIADTLQDALLTEPYPIPELAIGIVYHQATVGGRIGGDFYDFIPVGEGCTAIVVGDITGKGLSAARYTTIGKGAIRSFAFDDPDPASVLTRASRVIAEQIGAEHFVTAAYLQLGLASGSLTYAVAGHPPPLLYRVADGSVEPLPGGGVPLGIEPESGYEDQRTRMEPGDRLLLYTDGLSEARRGTELFGLDRVIEAFAAFRGVPVRDVASGIAEAAIAFAGGALGDDLAIIVLERRASAGGAGRSG